MVTVRRKCLLIVFVLYMVSLVSIYKYVLFLQGHVTSQDALNGKYVIDYPDISSIDPYKLNWNPEAKVFFKKIKESGVNSDSYQYEADMLGDCTLDTRIDFRLIADGLFVYSAYIDNRTGEPFVRTFAAMKKWMPSKFEGRLWCHFEDDGPTAAIGSFVSSKLALYQMCENHNMDYGAWMFSCPIPSQITSAPNFFRLGNAETSRKSLTQSKFICIRTRDKRVESRKLNFGVCVPPLFGGITTKQLIEFIELNRLLGAERFVFYVEESERSVSMEIKKILRYYENLNIVTLVPWLLPFSAKSIWYHGQSIAINDCVYRNMYQFEHLVFVDLDEFLVPHGDIQNWNSLLRAMNRRYNYEFVKASGFSFKPAYFDPERSRKVFSNEMDTCVRINRTQKYSWRRTKLMVRPERVFELGIHHVSKAFPVEANVTVVKVEPELAYIHHYRECVFEFGIRCPMITGDETIPNKYGEMLLQNYMKSKYDIHA